MPLIVFPQSDLKPISPKALNPHAPNWEALSIRAEPANLAEPDFLQDQAPNEDI